MEEAANSNNRKQQQQHRQKQLAVACSSNKATPRVFYGWNEGRQWRGEARNTYTFLPDYKQQVTFYPNSNSNPDFRSKMGHIGHQLTKKDSVEFLPSFVLFYVSDPLPQHLSVEHRQGWTNDLFDRKPSPPKNKKSHHHSKPRLISPR